MKHLSESAQKIEDMLSDGCIVYRKNGIIEAVKQPEFGKIVLTFQDDKLMFVERRELKKV